MSETKTQKFLYETSVQRLFTEKVVEKKEDGTEISRPVKKLKPIKIALLKPNRKLHENAEIFFAKTMANLIREGLLPYSLVAKRYANDGGALSEPEKVYLENLRQQLITLEQQFVNLIDKKDEESEKNKTDILFKMNSLREEFAGIESAYADIFNNTAEIKPRNKLMEWWAMHLSYIDEDEKGYKCLFGDGNLDEKFNKYDYYDDLNDPFYNDIISRLSYLTAFWFSARRDVTKSDFESNEKTYEKKLSTYHPEELIEKVEVKIEPKIEPKVENIIEIPKP